MAAIKSFSKYKLYSFDKPGEVVNHLILEPGEVPPDTVGQHQVVVHQQTNKEPIVFLQVSVT